MRTARPTPICAVDGEERAAGIISSKSPNVSKRTTRCNFIFIPRALWACLGGQHQKGDLPQTLARNVFATRACVDEGLAYLNTTDWRMLLSRKLFEMRTFRGRQMATRSGFYPIDNRAVAMFISLLNRRDVWWRRKNPLRTLSFVYLPCTVLFAGATT